METLARIILTAATVAAKQSCAFNKNEQKLQVKLAKYKQTQQKHLQVMIFRIFLNELPTYLPTLRQVAKFKS